MENETNEELICQIAGQDKQAFERLVKNTHTDAYRYLLRLLSNSKDVDDVMQEGYMAIWLKANTFKPGLAFSPWFYRVFYHCFVDHVRKHKHDAGPLIHEPISSIDPQAHLETEQYYILIDAFLRQLPTKERSIFILFYYQRQKTKDIAQIMTSTEQSIQSILYRIRKQLKQWLESHE